MFKFFKKIRQELLGNRRFHTYLTYAFGEIVLVVLGILIALSINKLKENEDRKEMERQLYRDIQTELREDLKGIEGNNLYNKRFLKRYKKGSHIILTDQNREMMDSLAVIASELTKFSDFKNDWPIYDRLFSSGEHDLIRDKKILTELKRLALLYNYINRIEKDQQDFMYTVLPKIADFIRINPPEIKDPESLYGYRFHNDIEILIIIMREKDMLYEQAEDQLTELLTKLEEKQE